MERCLLDTTALSDLIQPTRHRLAIADRHLAQYLREWGRVTFSHVSCFEILRGLRKKGANKQLDAFRELCEHSELLPVTYEVFDFAAGLWAEGQARGMTVDDADLIVAATAMRAKISVVTANVRHFDWIVGLTVRNWREA